MTIRTRPSSTTQYLLQDLLGVQAEQRDALEAENAGLRFELGTLSAQVDRLLAARAAYTDTPACDLDGFAEVRSSGFCRVCLTVISACGDQSYLATYCLPDDVGVAYTDHLRRMRMSCIARGTAAQYVRSAGQEEHTVNILAVRPTVHCAATLDPCQ